MNDFQRKGYESNTQVAREFESIAYKYFYSNEYDVEMGYNIKIGLNLVKKEKKFTLGGRDNLGKTFVVECKSHKWTESSNIPSAKITNWRQSMFYFSMLPEDIGKYLFVLKDKSVKTQESLGEYFIRLNQHLIPKGVIILEYDPTTENVERLY